MKEACEKNIKEAVEKMDGWYLGDVFRRDVMTSLGSRLLILGLLFL